MRDVFKYNDVHRSFQWDGWKTYRRSKRKSEDECITVLKESHIKRALLKINIRECEYVNLIQMNHNTV